MRIPTAIRTLAPLVLMALLTSCERPHGPPPPKAAAGTTAPAAVALSGSILDPPPNPAPARPASQGAKAPAPAKPATAGTGAAGSSAGYSPEGAIGTGVVAANQQALRDFQTEQEQRDRELLDQDLDEAQLRASGQAWQREREAAALYEPEAVPPDDELVVDELPFYDEPGLDDGYDARDGPYRP